MISLKFNKISVLFLFLIFLNTPVTSQEKKFEVQYGTGGWYEIIQKAEPEIEKTYFLTNKLKLGYRLTPYFSVGMSSTYIFRKSYNKHKHIILPDEILFEVWRSRDKNIGFGPYLKFNMGQNFNFSIASELNYSFGTVNTASSVEWQEYTDKNNNDLNYTSKCALLELSIGKRIYDNFFIAFSFNEQYVFFKKNSRSSSNNFNTYSQHYLGVNFNYYFNLKNTRK